MYKDALLMNNFKRLLNLATDTITNFQEESMAKLCKLQSEVNFTFKMTTK